MTLSWPMEDLLNEVAGEIEVFSAQIGLRVMQAAMEHEVNKKVGVGSSRAPNATAPNPNTWCMGALGEYGVSSDARQPLLFVIDGAKALQEAIREVFGADAPVQRCRVH